MSDPKRSDGEKLFYIISVYAQVAYRSGLKDDASEPKDYEIYQGMFEAVIGMIANQNKVEPNEIYDQWKSASELEAPWTYGEDAEAAKAAVESLIVFYLRMPSK